MADIQQIVGDGVASGFEGIVTYTLWGIVICAILYLIYRQYMDWKVYKNRVRIFRQRQNGTKIEVNTKGGYIRDKGGVTNFWIKTGKIKRFKMASLPDPDAIDEENRVYYHQISPTDYIQTKAEFIYEDTYKPNPDFIEPSFEEGNKIIAKWADDLIKKGEITDQGEALTEAMRLYGVWLDENKGEYVNLGKVVYSPMPQSSKESAINDLIHAKGVLGVDANKQFMYFVIGAIAILALGAIVFYIATNEGRFPILESFLPLLSIKNKFK